MSWLSDLRRAVRRTPPAETRQSLIAQKETVIAEIANTRARLTQARASRSGVHREAEMEAVLQSLMAEERRLRLLIDRAAKDDAG